MHFSVENQNGNYESSDDLNPAHMLRVFGVRSAEDKNKQDREKYEREQARKEKNNKQDPEKKQDLKNNGQQDPKGGAGPSASGLTGKA